MKWKLTLRYVISTAIVALLVVIVNLIILLVFIKLHSNADNSSSMVKSSENLVRNFKDHVHNDGENVKDIYIDKKGKEIIKKSNLWMQILDESGKELYKYNVSFKIKNTYTPFDLINIYKYREKENDNTIVFIDEKVINGKRYSYIIGFPDSKIQRYILIFGNEKFLGFFGYPIISILIVDLFVALLIGYIFSISLTKPVKKIINGVEDLSDGNYLTNYKEEGIYKPVLKKLNGLSDKLKENECERKKLESMKNEWIANISHDIKTPLASINGYAELMSEGYDIEIDEVSDYSKVISDKAYYIKELVDDLNLTMKLKSNNSFLSKSNENIVSIVKNCIIDILNDPKYEMIDINFESEKENIILNLDKILIKRVINNLIYNSIIHNTKDIKINVSITTGIKTIIVIDDNGKGISNRDLKYIFDRYYRGTNTGESHKGSGLGMAIARDIIIAHGGDINIESEIDKWTSVKIIFKNI